MANKMAVKEIGRRLTGITAFSFGAQWQYTESEREMVRRFIVFLEDRRSLYVPTQIEIESDVGWSVQAIREQCVKTIGELSDGSSSAGPVRAIRAACRKYLQSCEQEYPNIIALDQNAGRAAPWLIALGELRATVGAQIALLAFAHDLELEEELATILPAEDC